MARTIRLAVAIGLLAALVVGTGTVAADGGPRKILDTRLVGVPSPPVTVLGVNGGWRAVDDRQQQREAVRRRHARPADPPPGLRRPAPTQGTNTVPQGRATVVCNGNANPATDRVNSDPIAILASLRATPSSTALLTLPSPCFAPVVFFTSSAATGSR